jgi:hypothetical protein
MDYSPVTNGAAASAAPQGSEPPPLPGDAWYYAVGSERRGPVSASALRAQAGITQDTLVWRRGMTEWAPASAVPELASIIAAKS